MLHVTNGTSVSLDRSGLGGEVVYWVDVLHEGPVPAGLDFAELSRLRSAFLDSAWPGDASAAGVLARRDAALGAFANHDEVALWFEHDLYDQLHLIQILDWFRNRNVGTTRLSLICVDRYLGMLTGEELAGLWPHRHPVRDDELELAGAAWHAFRSPDPMEIERLLRRDLSALPFLAAALRRHLQQYPSVAGGLARTERQILELVDAGHTAFPQLFAANAKREEAIFMGDCVFYGYLNALTVCRYPLLEHTAGAYRLTQTGRDVLQSRADHVRLNGINRWLGGVHLDGADALWRWNAESRHLERR